MGRPERGHPERPRRMWRFSVVCAVACILLVLDAAPLKDAPADDFGEENNQPMHSADQMSKLLRIKDEVEALSSPVSLASNAASGVRSLGDSTPDEERHVLKSRPRVHADLVALDRLLDEFEQTGEKLDRGNLGETQHTKLVSAKKLSSMIAIRSDRDSARVVKRVVQFLSAQRKQSLALSRAELDEVRQFYIDQTANVLARYGYEDSPYGQHDVSARRGDAVAARQHMDRVDERLHMAAQQPQQVQSKGVRRVIQYLKETSRLSEFLARLAHVHAESTEAKHSLHNNRMSNLAKLQADEEAITDGIEQLLHKIKRGKPLKNGDVSRMTASNSNEDRVDTSAKGLAKRAADESVRLKKLQAELSRADTPAAKKMAQKKVDDARADAIRDAHAPRNVAIPLPKLNDELNGYVTEELDHTLRHFRQMQSHGTVISPKVKARINQYLRLITAHLLKTYLKYDEWTDKSALLKETSAVKAGDPGAPSRIRVGHPMASKKIVEHFLSDTWHRPLAQQHVPLSVQQILQHGATLPNGARVTIVVSREP